MPLTDKQDTLYLRIYANAEEVPAAIKAALEKYPEVRIVSQQIFSHAPYSVFLVVESV